MESFDTSLQSNSDTDLAKAPEQSPSSQPQPPDAAIEAEQIETLIDDPETRKGFADTLLGFSLIYLAHYLTLPPADFHKELFEILSDWSYRFFSAIGFRGSGKSSLMSLGLPLWAGLEGKSHFIIIISDTRDQAVENIANLRHELETNPMILRDYGDVSEGVSKQKEWTKTSLILRNGTKILGLSRGQRIRGRRHREYRPDLVIIDDPETPERAAKKEYRDKTERWMRGEVIPAIEESKARLIVGGNIVHTDGLMMRLKGDPLFTHRDYSLLEGGDTWEHCTWKAKYPNQAALDRKKREVGYIAWMREYLLKVIPPEGQEVKPEWLTYYDALPTPIEDEKTKQIINPIAQVAVGVDLAISKSAKADFTAMVAGITIVEQGVPKLYIMAKPINARLSFHETIQQMRSLTAALSASVGIPVFHIEDVAYQKAAIQEAQRHGIAAYPVKVGSDKRARLRAASTFIQNGTVLFPKRGAEDLLAQLTGFGIEDHDDLVDAFVHLVLGMRKTGMEMPEVISLLDD